MKKITQILICTLFSFLSTTIANAQTFEWAKTFGGVSFDYTMSVVVDAQGNIYTTGYFYGTADFDPGAGTYNLTSNGGSDGFIQKLDTLGNLLWAKAFGGISDDYASSIAVDSLGNVYTTGGFQGIIYFDPSTNTYNLTSNGNIDCFIQKLDGDGNFVWAKAFGGTGYDGANSIAVDTQGNVYTVGYFLETTDFDPNTGTYNLTSNGATDGFIQKLDASGNFEWAKTFGGAGSDEANSVTIDSQGNVYIVGFFQETIDFDPSPSTYNLTSNGYSDGFIQKLDVSGNFVWAKAFGGTSFDYTMSVAVDAQSNVYAVGYFYGTADFDPGAGTYNLTPNGDSDYFIQKLDASGNWVWAKTFGGTGLDVAYSVAVDSLGNVYTVGFFYETVDFDPGADTCNLTSNGNIDYFIQKLDTSGNLLWAKTFGGTGPDVAFSVALDAQNNVYTVGYFNGTVDFDPSISMHNLTSNGSDDGFIQKLSQCFNTSTDTQTACNSYTWIDGNTYTANNNTATHTLTNTAGCDSVITLNLTINTPNTGTDVKTACNRYVWIDGNTYTTSNNTATHTLTNIGGCDSVVTLNLSINTMPTISTVQNGLTLEVTASMDSYQWYLNNTAINGATNATYVATANGSYYCVVVKGACSQNSDTININQVSINEIVFEGLKIYPNPAKDILYIEVQEKLEQIQLIDLNGKVVKDFNAESRKLNISTIAKGIYFIKLNNATKQSIQKVVIF